MSKTDKTKPYWVQVMHGDVPSVEQHDHADGVCDLLGHIKDKHYVQPLRGQCYIQYWFDGRNHFCGCWLCTGHIERKAANRKQRRDARRDIAERLEV